MNDLMSDEGDEVLDQRTVEDEVNQLMASLKLKYPKAGDLVKSKEFQIIRERLELIEGKIRSELLLSKFI